MNLTNNIKELKNVDKDIIQIVKKGLKISFAFSILASIILVLYCCIFNNPIVYKIGISFLETSLFYISTCIMCGFGFSIIKNELM